MLNYREAAHLGLDFIEQVFDHGRMVPHRLSPPHRSRQVVA
jgi:hypothetical protein